MFDGLSEVLANVARFKTVPTVTIVCATKTVPARIVASLPSYGLTAAGENRVQELCEKYEQIGNAVSWRFIGRLQRNKVKKIVGIVDCIESVDSFALADEIERQATLKGVCVGVLAQINAGGEESKGGVPIDRAATLMAYLSGKPHLKLQGIMGVFPKNAPKRLYEDVRAVFDEHKQEFGLTTLSMGMSDDYVTALSCGATEIRLGRALTGDRSTR